MGIYDEAESTRKEEPEITSFFTRKSYTLGAMERSVVLDVAVGA